MLRRLLQMQGGNSFGLGKKLGGSLGWSSSCSISSLLEPLQLPRPLLGQLTALCGWQSRVRGSRVPEAWRGGPALERWWSCPGEVVLLEEAVAWGSAGKGRTGQLSRGWASLLEEGGIGEGGAARGDQGVVYSACICLQILTVYVHFYRGVPGFAFVIVFQ